MEQLPQPELMRQPEFKDQCLELFAETLSQRQYPGYPTNRLVLEEPVQDLPNGPWEINNDTLPSAEETATLLEQGYQLDSQGRPLHPWLPEMLTRPDIGTVTGKGFYWHWGPNYTADPIIVRHDLVEPHVLLISRRDTGQLALPGGFVDVDKNEEPLTAAIREAGEEALLDISEFGCTEVYVGPTTDTRTTAYAWPHTFAYRFDMPTDVANQLGTESYTAGDDALEAFWVSQTDAQTCLFGAHRLLIERAFQILPSSQLILP